MCGIKGVTYGNLLYSNHTHTCLAATLHPCTIAVSSRKRDTKILSPKGILTALPATAKISGSNG